jgi:hypothetical protein
MRIEEEDFDPEEDDPTTDKDAKEEGEGEKYR